MNAVLASSPGQKGVSGFQYVAYGREWELNNAPPFSVFNPQIRTIRNGGDKRTDMGGEVLSAESPEGTTWCNLRNLPKVAEPSGGLRRSCLRRRRRTQAKEKVAAGAAPRPGFFGGQA